MGEAWNNSIIRAKSIVTNHTDQQIAPGWFEFETLLNFEVSMVCSMLIFALRSFLRERHSFRRFFWIASFCCVNGNVGGSERTQNRKKKNGKTVLVEKEPASFPCLIGDGEWDYQVTYLR